MKTIIVDIDGTIAKISEERLAILNKKPIDYDAFYRCDFTKDEPIEVICNIVQDAISLGIYKIAFCTGRREEVREETEYWLANQQGFFYKNKLLMRKNNDIRSDDITKPELLKNAGYTPDNVAFILEDRTRMCKKWRELGFTCLQVAEGNY